MDKYFDELIASRCEKALQNDTNYLDVQNKLAEAHNNNDIETFCELSFRMQVIAVEVGYKLGMKDMCEIFNS